MSATGTDAGAEPVKPGAWLGRVLLVKKVATGGMGEVWEGRQQPLERRVAVKFLRPELADDAGVRARFLGEARSLASVDYPGVVAVHDVHDAPAAIVMGFVEGISLRSWISQTMAPPWERVRAFLVQIAQALHAVHCAGIVHRDLKPENVMLSQTAGVDRITIIDFGIARSSDSPRLTGTSPLGTAEYMSPEQWRGEVADARTDIYALGCLAFELLTGDPPFIGPSTTLLRREHQEDTPDSPTLIRTDLEAVDGLDGFVAKCLAKDPDERYASMQAVVDALGGLQAGVTTEATPASAPPRRAGMALAAFALSGVAAVAAGSAFWATWRSPAPSEISVPQPNPEPAERESPPTQRTRSDKEDNAEELRAPPEAGGATTPPETGKDVPPVVPQLGSREPVRASKPRRATKPEHSEADVEPRELRDLPRYVGPG